VIHRAAQAGAVTVVLALLGVLIWHFTHQGAGNVKAGQVAPLWTKSRVDTTGTLSLASLRGKVVVLNFWQSYCAPCTHEARLLADTSRSWSGKDVVFVGVDEQDLRGPALKFMRRFNITYPIVADDLGLTGHYGVTGYPETFFIDPHGRVVSPHIVGPATQKQLEDGIKRALGQK
jgi:cytochrome c biogenesis protein CcmG/thiol:disulfide interchange protein DsbE